MKIINSLKGKKVLVTGAGGYIGRHVTAALCDAGADTVALDRFTEQIDPRAKRISADIFSGSPDIYRELGCPDICLHMAWQDGFVHASDAHMQNLSAHYTFLRNMLEGGLRHMAVMGTMHEVGYYEGEINENTPCNPGSMYGIAKYALRKACFLLAEKYGACLQWLRAYYIMGDDRNNHSVFAKMLIAAENGQTAFPFTSGTHKFDFIDVDTLAEQIACTLSQTEIDGIIECCSGKPVSLGEQAEKFIAANGLKISLDYGRFKEPAHESPAVWGSAKKIEQIRQIVAKD